MAMMTYKPVIVDGVRWENYSITPEGKIVSDKSGQPRELSMSFPSKKSKSPYPRIKLSNFGKVRTFLVHRLVCEAFHNFPIPEGISKKEWTQTPAKVKKLLRSLYQVNHIDHDHLNFHPSNLEWVTVKQNSQKYQQHRTRVN